MLPLPCMLVCIFFSANRTRDRGCSKHPVFPAPSISKRANEDANLGRSAPRDRETMSTVIAPAIDQARQLNPKIEEANSSAPQRLQALEGQALRVADAGQIEFADEGSGRLAVAIGQR